MKGVVEYNRVEHGILVMMAVEKSVKPDVYHEST